MRCQLLSLGMNKEPPGSVQAESFRIRSATLIPFSASLFRYFLLQFPSRLRRSLFCFIFYLYTPVLLMHE